MERNPNDLPRDFGRDPHADLPSDLVSIARMLDDEGRAARAELGGEALERIYAASDLQLPLASEGVRPVAGRIHASKPRTIGLPAGLRLGTVGLRLGTVGLRLGSLGRVARIAAAVAILASLGGVLFVASRAISAWSKPTTAPEGVLAGAGGTMPIVPRVGDTVDTIERDRAPELPLREAGVAPDATRPATAAFAVAHLEAALGGSLSVRTAATPVAGVVAALSGTSATGLHHDFDGDDALGEFTTLIGAGALVDGRGATYDDLSGEFERIATLSSRR